jgi:tryptophanyl-tRNA synthetase
MSFSLPESQAILTDKKLSDAMRLIAAKHGLQIAESDLSNKLIMKNVVKILAFGFDERIEIEVISDNKDVAGYFFRRSNTPNAESCYRCYTTDKRYYCNKNEYTVRISSDFPKQLKQFVIAYIDLHL